MNWEFLRFVKNKDTKLRRINISPVLAEETGDLPSWVSIDSCFDELIESDAKSRSCLMKHFFFL